MPNEYRQSLQVHAEMKQRYDAFMEKRAVGERIPEEEFIAFLYDLQDRWSHMYAVEQRHDCRVMGRHVVLLLNAQYREPSKREPVHFIKGAFNVGIFGETIQDRGLSLDEILNYKVHEGKPVLTLQMVEAMADAVEKREQAGE